MGRCLWGRCVVALVVACLADSRVYAQTSTGAVHGVIRDASGAVVADTVVRLTDLDTNAGYQATTDIHGQFRIVQLPAGRYRVDAGHPALAPASIPDLRLAVHEPVEISLVLTPGGFREHVDVTASISPFSSSTSGLDWIVGREWVQALPLDTRNVYSLIALTPGVAGEIGNTHNRVNYSVNGARAGLMDTLIDGATAAFPTVNGGHGISVFPSVDAVMEFKVHAGNYPAEFGRSLGSVVNIVSRSGSNAFHGSVYGFYRNSRFDADTYFARRRGDPKIPFSRSQAGGVGGGPLKRNRTFLLVSYEGLRANTLRELLTTVPTVLERSGDFSRTRGANGSPIVIYDPLTTAPVRTGSGFIRSPFPSNRIPLERMDPVALNVLRYWPQPNQPGDPLTGRLNFYASGVAAVDTDNVDLRVDQVIGAGGRVFARFSNRRALDAPPQLFPGETALAQGRVVQSDDGQNVVVSASGGIGSGMLGDVRLALARNHFLFANQSLGFQPSSLGLPKTIDAVVDRLLFPAFAAADVAPLGGSDHRDSTFNTVTVVGSVSRQRGPHLVKVGYEGRRFHIKVLEARAAGTFSFGRLFTQGPNPLAASANAGYGFASFLLGAGSSGSVLQNWKNVDTRSTYHAFYVQDDWRAGERLTLNLGLRWDFDVPRTERFDRMSWFDPETPSPLAAPTGLSALKGGLQFVGVDGHPRSQYDGDWNNVAPRVGAAYRAARGTVLRAALGRFFGPGSHAAQGTVGPYGFRVETPWLVSLDSLTPLNYLRDPFPDGFGPVPGAAQGMLTALGGRIEAPLRGTRTPNTWQWNVAVQQALPWKFSVEAAYVGVRGRDLSLGGESGYTLNQLPASALGLGASLNTLVPNPFYGHVSSGPLAQPMVTQGQMLRPFPQFGDVIALSASGARSRYDGLQVSASRRFDGGWGVEASMVGSKSTDWGQRYQDAYNLAGHDALSPVHVPYRFVASGMYELPFGRGRAIGHSMSPALNAVVGGWQINGVWTLQAGSTLDVTASNTAGIFGQATRPNWTGASPAIDADDTDRLGRWFDTGVFSQPAPFSFGNAPERIPGLRGDRVDNLDISVLKHVRLHEAAWLQLRLEVFNVLNSVQFAAPNTSVTSASFGQVNAQANAPRQLQFGAKLLW